MVVTPDLDVYAEDLQGVADGPSRCKVKGVHFRYRSRVGGSIYKFAAPIPEGELKTLIRRGYEVAALEEDFDSEWRPSEVVVGETAMDFQEFFVGAFLPRRLRVKQLEGLPVNPRAELWLTIGPDTGTSWRVADARPGVALGRLVTPDPDTDLALDANDGVAK